MNKIKVDDNGRLLVNTEIWALFGIANDYDQPDNNLIVWWREKPAFDVLASALHIKVDKEKGDSQVGRILKGQSVRISGADYRLEKIKEGKILE